MKQRKEHCRKKSYEKVTFQQKLLVIDEIQKGQISINFASKKYSTLEQQYTGMSKKDEIKKLMERIEELDFVKEFQQDIIADMEIITGVDMSKKSLPETLAKEIELKKKMDLSMFWD